MDSFPATVVLPDGAGSLQLTLPALDTYRSALAALAVHPSSCMFTAVRLELDVPGLFPRPIALTEGLDLYPLVGRLCAPDAPAATLRVTAEAWTLRSARHHVRRLREALANPPVAPARPTAAAAPATATEGQGAATAPPAAAVADDASATGAAAAVVAAADAVASPEQAPAQDEEGSSSEGRPAFHTGADYAMFLAQLPDLVGPALAVAISEQRVKATAAAAHFGALALPVPTDPSLVFPVPSPAFDDVRPQTRPARDIGDEGDDDGEDEAAEGKHTKTKAAAAGDNKGSARPDVVALPAAPYVPVPTAPPGLPATPAAAGSAAKPEPFVRCVKSVTFSQWNPPPAPVSSVAAETRAPSG